MHSLMADVVEDGCASPHEKDEGCVSYQACSAAAQQHPHVSIAAVHAHSTLGWRNDLLTGRPSVVCRPAQEADSSGAAGEGTSSKKGRKKKNRSARKKSPEGQAAAEAADEEPAGTGGASPEPEPLPSRLPDGPPVPKGAATEEYWKSGAPVLAAFPPLFADSL